MTPAHGEPAPSSVEQPKGRVDGVATAVLAVGMGIALALVVDLAGPKRNEGKLATTAPSTMPASDLAARMDAQIAAGAPGVALALEEAAKPSERGGAAVAAARARAQFELGDAPKALETVRVAIKICEVTHGCTTGERASLSRLDLIIGAIVGAGVVDPKSDPARVDTAIQNLVPSAGFSK
jgi:hypothetical protein